MIKLLLLAQLAFTTIDTGTFKVKVSGKTVSDSAMFRALPIPLTRVIADLGGNCAMFMFKDSSFVLRTWQKSDTTCIRKFNLIPEQYRKTAGYVQKRTDEICMLPWGSNQPSGICDDVLMMNYFRNMASGWSTCTPTAISCGAETTVMDFNETQKERYENGVCWLGDRYGIGGDIHNPDQCFWSGWVYPYKPFPGRWETAANWIFFIKKSQ